MKISILAFFLSDNQGLLILFQGNIYCCTCFSTCDIGVQVSVHLFVCPSISPSVHPSIFIYSGCLVSATPLTVLYQSFWNFACVFFMVWGCACGLDIIVTSFFVTFYTPPLLWWGIMLWLCIPIVIGDEWYGIVNGQNLSIFNRVTALVRIAKMVSGL